MTGEGSIFQRADGKWVAQKSLGGRTDRSYRRRVRSTRRAAVAALAELEADARAWAAPSRRSLGDYLRRWLDESIRGNVAPNTLRSYEASLMHFAPIHHISLAELRAEHIEEACNRMRSTRYMGPRRPMTDEGPASPKTVRNAQVMLRAALEQAYQRGHVRRNEAKLVRLARVPRNRRLAMTADLARRVLAAFAGDRYEAAYALGFAALRESEILGLTVASIDLDAGTLRVTHQLRGSGPRAQLAQAKTASSEETVNLPAFVLERVRNHVARHDPVALLFTTERGYAVNGSWFNKHFQKLLADAGLPKMRVHDLRSAAATLLAEGGAHPKAAQEFLRHASETTTLRHYTRTTPEQRRSTAQLLDDVVQGRGVTR